MPCMLALLGPTIAIFAEQQHPKLDGWSKYTDKWFMEIMVGVHNVVSKSNRPIFYESLVFIGLFLTRFKSWTESPKTPISFFISAIRSCRQTNSD